MVTIDEQSSPSSQWVVNVVRGGVGSGRTAAVINDVIARAIEAGDWPDRRPASVVVTRPARLGDVSHRIQEQLAPIGRNSELVRAVSVEALARSLVEAHGDVVAAVPEGILSSELARRTLLVRAIEATELLSPWPLSIDFLLDSSVRVIDQLAEVGTTTAEATTWQATEVDRLERRTDTDDAAAQTSLRSLREMARRRTDLLAVATTYERLKRQRGLLDTTDVFRRATWLAERGYAASEKVWWSMLAIDDLDLATNKERRFLDALLRGESLVVCCSTGLSDEIDAVGCSVIEDLASDPPPSDAIDRGLRDAHSSSEPPPSPITDWPGIRAEVFADEAAEDTWIVESIGKALEGGVDPGEIAVIALSPERVASLERRMLDRSIPCRRIARPLQVGSTATGDVLAVADLLVNPDDAVAATRLGRSPRYQSSRMSARDTSAPDGAEALAADVARWLRTAADRGPQHALVEAIGDLGIERVLAISNERWAAGELRAVRAELCHLDDPAHAHVSRSPAVFRSALRSLIGVGACQDTAMVGQGCVSLVAAGPDATDVGSWNHVYLMGASDEAIEGHHRLEDETIDAASLPLALLKDPLEIPLGGGGRTVEVLARRMRRRRQESADEWFVGLARSARMSISLSHAAAPRRVGEVHETAPTESRVLHVLKEAGLAVRRPRPAESATEDVPPEPSGSRPLAPPQGTSLLLIEGGIEDAIASHPESDRLRTEVAELVAHLTPGAGADDVGFAPLELSARELFLAETDPDRYVQEVMLDLPEPPSAAADRTARLRAWLELDASRRTDRDGHGVLVTDGPIIADPLEEMSRLLPVDDRDLDLPGIGSESAALNLVESYRATPYGSMILNEAGRSLIVISQGRLVRSRLFGVVDQPDGVWQVIDVRVGPATALDWYRLGLQALALRSPSRSLGTCRLVVVGLDEESASVEVKPSPSADHLTRRLSLQWQIVDLVGS